MIKDSFKLAPVNIRGLVHLVGCCLQILGFGASSKLVLAKIRGLVPPTDWYLQIVGVRASNMFAKKRVLEPPICWCLHNLM